jgi:hypothetical protein
MKAFNLSRAYGGTSIYALDMHMLFFHYSLQLNVFAHAIFSLFSTAQCLCTCYFFIILYSSMFLHMLFFHYSLQLNVCAQCTCYFFIIFYSSMFVAVFYQKFFPLKETRGGGEEGAWATCTVLSSPPVPGPAVSKCLMTNFPWSPSIVNFSMVTLYQARGNLRCLSLSGFILKNRK